jgi:hypothetical protein
MNSQSFYVDANNSYVDVARSYDMRTTSASPNSYYVQTPMQNNLHASNSYNFSNMQHIYSNSHASATPEVYMPMDNVMSSVNQYKTLNVINFDNMQNSVSPFYSSANNLQYVGSPSHMPMDATIGHATGSYFANYSQPSYATSYVTNFSTPYATKDINNSATHLHNDYSRISENSIGSHVPSSSVVACDTTPTQLQNFGNTTHVSLPKDTDIYEGRSSKEWLIYIGNLVKILQIRFSKLELCEPTNRKRLTWSVRQIRLMSGWTIHLPSQINIGRSTHLS